MTWLWDIALHIGTLTSANKVCGEKMKPSKHLFVPLKNGEWLRDSQGRARMYKSQSIALANLKALDYDTMQIFAIDDVLSREEFERIATRESK